MRADLRSYGYARHTHDGYIIAVTESGGSQVFSRGVAEAMDANVLFVSNPAEVQASWMNGTSCWQHRSFYLDATGVAEVARTFSFRCRAGIHAELQGRSGADQAIARPPSHVRRGK